MIVMQKLHNNNGNKHDFVGSFWLSSNKTTQIAKWTYWIYLTTVKPLQELSVAVQVMEKKTVNSKQPSSQPASPEVWKTFIQITLHWSYFLVLKKKVKLCRTLGLKRSVFPARPQLQTKFFMIVMGFSGKLIRYTARTSEGRCPNKESWICPPKVLV